MLGYTYGTDGGLCVGGHRSFYLWLIGVIPLTALSGSATGHRLHESCITYMTLLQCMMCVTYTALLKRRYVAAGVALAMCLIHGGPCPRFFSTTLYSMLLGNLESNVTLDDIHDVTVNCSLTQVRCISCDDVFMHNDVCLCVVNVARRTQYVSWNDEQWLVLGQLRFVTAKAIDLLRQCVFLYNHRRHHRHPAALCWWAKRRKKINNNHDDIYSAVIMTRSLREFTRFICWMYSSAKRPPTLRPSHMTWAVSQPVLGS